MDTQGMYARMRLPADLVVLLSALLIVTANVVPWVRIPQHGADAMVINGFQGPSQGGGLTSGVLLVLMAVSMFVMVVCLSTIFYQRRVPAVLSAAVIILTGLEAGYMGYYLLHTFREIAKFSGSAQLSLVIGPGAYMLMAGGALGAIGGLLELSKVWAPAPVSVSQ